MLQHSKAASGRRAWQEVWGSKVPAPWWLASAVVAGGLFGWTLVVPCRWLFAWLMVPISVTGPLAPWLAVGVVVGWLLRRYSIVQGGIISSLLVVLLLGDRAYLQTTGWFWLALGAALGFAGRRGVHLGAAAGARLPRGVSERSLLAFSFAALLAIGWWHQRPSAAGETYFRGDGVGFNARLRLASNGTFTYALSGCLGPYGVNGGTYSRQGTLLVLHPVTGPDGDVWNPQTIVLRNIAWGQRHYLIPAQELKQFEAAVAAHREPRKRPFGLYYLRLGDHLLPAPGRPLAPGRTPRHAGPH